MMWIFPSSKNHDLLSTKTYYRWSQFKLTFFGLSWRTLITFPEMIYKTKNFKNLWYNLNCLLFQLPYLLFHYSINYILLWCMILIPFLLYFFQYLSIFWISDFKLLLLATSIYIFDLFLFLPLLPVLLSTFHCK